MNQRILELAGITPRVQSEIMEQKEVTFDSKVNFLLEMKLEGFDPVHQENGRDEALLRKFAGAPRGIAVVVHESSDSPVYYFMKNGNNCGWLNRADCESNLQINEMLEEFRRVMSGHNASKYFVRLYI
jgi:hypothetical protein